jgi:phage shock protein C
MRKLYRLEKDKKIGGVCAGLADMLNWDPTLVRLAVVFAAVLTGFFPVIVTYLVAWYLMPEKDVMTSERGNE